MTTKSYMLTIGVLAMSVFLSAVMLSGASVSADDSVVDVVNVTVPVSCTLSGTGMNSHTAEISNGSYQANIGTTTLKAFCNDNNGFAIYAAGYTGNEIGATNSNKLVGTSASGNATIVTGTATTAGNPDTSNWAMKLAITGDSGDTTGTNAITIDSAPNTSGGADASFSQYHVVPNEYTKVAHKNTSTDMNSTTGGATLTTTYAAYISKTQPADTYTGQVIYTLVHPATHVAPVYLNPNADDISEVTYMQQFAVVGDANRQAIIDSMVPEQQYTLTDSRDGKSYTIAKLNIGEDWTEYDRAAWYIDSCEGGECDSSLYDELSSDWQDFVDSCNGSWDNWDDTIAQSLVSPAYDVWMTQNLDLDLDSSVIYTNKDTDIGYNDYTGEYETAAWSPMRSTYSATNTQTHEWCNGGTWHDGSYGGYCESNNTPESYDPGDLYWNTMAGDYNDYWDYSDSCNRSTSTPSCDQSLNPISSFVSSTGTAQYHLGNFYNWAAALATNNSSVYGSEYYPEELVEQSICPVGWTLPRGGDNDSFQNAWESYGWQIIGRAFSNDVDPTGSPLYLAATGYFDNGVLVGVGYAGNYWLSESLSPDFAQSVYFYVSGGANPGAYDVRSAGMSVRCIARPVVGEQV